MGSAYKFCPKCGARNKPGAKFCSQCGAEQPSYLGRKEGRTTKKWLAAGFSIALIIAVALVVLITRGRAPVILKLVPEDADLIYGIRIAEILRDKDIQELYGKIAAEEPSAPKSLAAAISELEEESGVDLQGFDEAVMFGDTSSIIASAMQGKPPYGGGIVKGDFGKEIVQNMEEKAGEEFKVTSYKGHRIYTDESEEFGFAFPDGNLMAVGSMEAVRDVIDVKVGDKEPIGGKVYDDYNMLGDALIKGVSRMPTGLLRLIPSEIPEGEMGEMVGPLYSSIAAPLRDLDALSFLLTKEGREFVLEEALLFASKDSAEAIGDTFSDVIGMVKYMIPPGEEWVSYLLRDLDLEVENSRFSIRLSLTVDEIAEIVRYME